MTTLEKLCRAACEAEGFDPERYWRTYEKAVNGVLKALEEPSEEMVAAARSSEWWKYNEVRDDYEPNLATVFTAMIRKAQSQ